MKTARTFALMGALVLTLAAQAQPAGRKLWNEGWAFSPDGITCANVLKLGARDLPKHLRLEVDGTLSRARVCVNGEVIGIGPMDPSSWALDLTPWVVPGNNVIEIQLHNAKGGLYRNVWLTETEEIAVDHWGSQLTAQLLEEGHARVTQRLRMKADYLQHVDFHTEIFYLSKADGKCVEQLVAESRSAESIYDGKEVEQQFELVDARLWSPESPNLYLARATVEGADGESAVYETLFGIRRAESRSDGLWLNGKKTAVKGVRIGTDAGILGEVWNEDVWAHRLMRLRELGYNAIGPDQKPVAPELLDLCDRLGFLVSEDVAQEGRDRNHPCLVSLGKRADFDAFPLDRAGFPKDDQARAAGSAYKLVATPEYEGKQLTLVTVEIQNRKGGRVPTASQQLSFNLQGPATLVAVDAGDPAFTAPLGSTQLPAFHGRALALIRRTGEGPITLTVTAPGIRKAVISL